MIRIKNPDILRSRLQKTEEKIKAIVSKCHNGYTWDRCQIQRNSYIGKPGWRGRAFFMSKGGDQALISTPSS